jgi:hypothetical protein
MTLESRHEGRFNLGVKKLGGMTIKLVPVRAGLPDRLVLMPGGRTYLAELKTDTGRLRPIQKVVFEKLAAIGHPVYVVAGRDGVDTFLQMLKEDQT